MLPTLKLNNITCSQANIILAAVLVNIIYPCECIPPLNEKEESLTRETQSADSGWGWGDLSPRIASDSIIPTVWPLSPYIINSYHTPSQGPRANHWIRAWRWGSFVERLLQIVILTSGEQFTSHPSDASRASWAHIKFRYFTQSNCIIQVGLLFVMTYDAFYLKTK